VSKRATPVSRHSVGNRCKEAPIRMPICSPGCLPEKQHWPWPALEPNRTHGIVGVACDAEVRFRGIGG